MGFDAERRRNIAASGRDRRRRRLFDLSLDLRSGAGPGRELPSGPLQDPILSRRRPRRRDLQAADRSLSRRRPADLDLCRRASDGHRRQGARHRSSRDQAPQSGPRRRNFRTGSLRGSSGTRPASSNAWTPPPRPPATSSFAKNRAEARKQGRLFGIGIASYAELTGIGSRIAVAPGMPINTGSETAKITIDSTGAITAAFGVASHGQGLETTLAQIVADDLGARFEDIRVIQGDSDEVPMSTGTYASRSAVLGGGAAKHASKILQEKIKRVASHLLEANGDDIDVSDGKAVVSRYRPRGDVQADRQSGLFRMKTLAGRGARGADRDLHLRPDQRDNRGGHPYRRSGGRPRDLLRADPEIRRRRGLRPDHQPDDRRRPGARWRGARHRRRAFRGARSTTRTASS